jgi:hypothetical protein
MVKSLLQHLLQLFGNQTTVHPQGLLLKQQFFGSQGKRHDE